MTRTALCNQMKKIIIRQKGIEKAKFNYGTYKMNLAKTS
jgi:hypothetical protein